MHKTNICKITTYWVEKCIYPENNAINPHVHDFFHCFCDIEGKRKITSDKMVYYMNQNSIFFVKPNEQHGFENISKHNLITYEIKFDTQHEDLKYKLINLPFHINSSDYINNLFSMAYDEAKIKRPYNTEMMNAYIVQILCTLLRTENHSNQVIENLDNPNKTDGFNKVVQYIDRNISKDLSLEQLSEYVHLEKVYFLKKFTKLTGLTPMKYIKTMRMKKAKTLLQFSDMSITMIAESVGFKNIQYFSRVFTEYYNVNPSLYRSSFYKKK